MAMLSEGFYSNRMFNLQNLSSSPDMQLSESVFWRLDHRCWHEPRQDSYNVPVHGATCREVLRKSFGIALESCSSKSRGISHPRPSEKLILHKVSPSIF